MTIKPGRKQKLILNLYDLSIITWQLCISKYRILQRRINERKDKPQFLQIENLCLPNGIFRNMKMQLTEQKKHSSSCICQESNIQDIQNGPLQLTQ